jgi:hypothetical protein
MMPSVSPEDNRAPLIGVVHVDDSSRDGAQRHGKTRPRKVFNLPTIDDRNSLVDLKAEEAYNHK